jgi:hypothetical protein
MAAVTYNLGNHAAVKLDVALSFPDDIHVELDIATLSLVSIYSIDSHGNRAEVEFSEPQLG